MVLATIPLLGGGGQAIGLLPAICALLIVICNFSINRGVANTPHPLFLRRHNYIYGVAVAVGVSVGVPVNVDVGVVVAVGVYVVVGVGGGVPWRRMRGASQRA